MDVIFENDVGSLARLLNREFLFKKHLGSTSDPVAEILSQQSS
jgi:hypothetical protein